MVDSPSPGHRQPPQNIPPGRLFRPEAMAEPEYGEALAFTVPPWRVIAATAAAALATFFTFSLFAAFDRTATARGVLAPQSGVSRLSARQPGIVARVHARQGDRVSRGDVIITLSPLDALPDGSTASARALETYRAQLEAVALALDAERQQRGLEQLRLREQMSAVLALVDSLRTQRQLQQQRILSNERRLQSLGSLRAKGFVSEAAYQEQEETVLALRQQLSALHQRETEAAHDLARTRVEEQELAAAERAAAQSARATLLTLDRSAAAAQAGAQTIIASPVSGTLAALNVAAGMTVETAQELAAVVRPDEPLHVMLFVAPAASGGLRRGQHVALRYDAFPYQRYGVGRGVIESVASTAVVERPGAAPTYRVKVRLLDGNRFALRTDMTLTAVITLERRSLLDWLLAPLNGRLRNAQAAT